MFNYERYVQLRIKTVKILPPRKRVQNWVSHLLGFWVEFGQQDPLRISNPSRFPFHLRDASRAQTPSLRQPARLLREGCAAEISLTKGVLITVN